MNETVGVLEDDTGSVALASTIKTKGSKGKSKKKKPAKKVDRHDLVGGLLFEPGEVTTIDKDMATSFVKQYLTDIHQNYFMLGGILSLIKSEGWYEEDGYDKFKDYVQTEYGLHDRKARYLIGIHDGLVSAGIDFATVSSLGWSKLKEIAEILTEDNVDHWVDLANELTIVQLKAAVKDATAGDKADDKKVKEASELSTMSFKVHADQKEVIEEALEKALHEFGTEFKPVALEQICMGYLAGGKATKAPKQKSLKAQIKDEGYEKSLTLISDLFPKLIINVDVED